MKYQNELEGIVRELIAVMRNGFMTVTAGPDIKPFINIKFATLEEADRAHREIIELAKWVERN